MIQDSYTRGFDQHDVRLYQPHYIHQLCQDNDTKALARTLAGDKTGVNMRDQNEMTPLHLTVVTADPPYLDSLMLRLIRSGAELDARLPSNGNTALHLAILYSKESNAELSVPILLREGATPAIRNHLGKTPFDYALANDYRRIAGLLADVEEDPSRAKQIDPYLWSGGGAAATATPDDLHAAIRSGDRQKAGLLMRQLAQMAYRENCCPLHWAVTDSPDKRAMLQDLLNADADPQQVDQEKETPITLAIKSMEHDIEMLRVIYLLILAGVPKAHRNAEGKEALTLARELSYADVEELLITGRNPDAKAQPRRQVTIVEPNSPPPTQRGPPPPPLSQRSEPNQRPALQPRPPPARRAGADAAKFTGEYNQLHQLVMAKKGGAQMALDIEQLFRSNPNFDPDVPTNDEIGDTALHIVVRNQKTRAVEQLLANNATVDVKNKKKETPLSLARNGPWGWDREIEDMLLQAIRRQLEAKKVREAEMTASEAEQPAPAPATQKAAPAKAPENTTEKAPEKAPDKVPEKAAEKPPAAPPKQPNHPINQFTEQYHRLHQLVMQKGKSGTEVATEVDAFFRANPALDPDLKTNDEIGDTALHIAVRDQKTAVIRSLLKRNATVNIKNKKNESPLTLARTGPWGYDRDVEEMLLEANKRQLAAQNGTS